ncbi:MAG: metallophosphoesterase [Pirellulales bacterium]|nr:metallophosphoesterase [Pirellulales bacterium]
MTRRAFALRHGYFGSAMDLLLILLALLGHAFLWVALVNRTHSLAIPCRMGHMVTATFLAGLVLVPGLIAWRFFPAGVRHGVDWAGLPPAVMLYLAVCWLAAVAAVAWWTARVVLRRPPAVLRFHQTRSHVLRNVPGYPASREHAHHFLVHLPGNEILRLDVTERAIDVPRLRPALDGLTIVHVSDLHFTGRVGKGYFEEVIRRSNEAEPDLVAITGDLVDHSDYIDWIPDTLGRLRARFGVYYILGNHDVRVDMKRLRQVLADGGLVDLGGRWVRIEIQGEPVVLAGNELPWLAPAADMSRCPPRGADGGPLRIVLSHSPDQLGWAQGHDADLLLAGHTHGGQIRVPLIGPIFSPSSLGVKYASGLFYAPPTILHVTRGVSGELPVRLNCPPEMALLVLHAARRR